MWEYKIKKIFSFSMSEAILNEYGKEGWELVGIFDVGGFLSAVFKRPKK